MPLTLSLAALQHGTVRLQGEISAEDMALELNDPCLSAGRPLRYEIAAEMMGDEVLLQGWLETTLDCHCVRCLEPFEHVLRVDPWAALLALKGEDAAPVMAEAVDLTPQIREDSLLALPQHPVCRPECRGIPTEGPATSTPDSPSSVKDKRQVASAWSVLDKLKLD